VKHKLWVCVRRKYCGSCRVCWKLTIESASQLYLSLIIDPDRNRNEENRWSIFIWFECRVNKRNLPTTWFGSLLHQRGAKVESTNGAFAPTLGLEGVESVERGMFNWTRYLAGIRLKSEFAILLRELRDRSPTVCQRANGIVIILSWRENKSSGSDGRPDVSAGAYFRGTCAHFRTGQVWDYWIPIVRPIINLAEHGMSAEWPICYLRDIVWRKHSLNSPPCCFFRCEARVWRISRVIMRARDEIACWETRPDNFLII